MDNENPESISKATVGSFVNLLSQSERQLYTFILSLTSNWSEADEIAQQVRIRLWEQFNEYDSSKDFGAWSRSIAYYLILAHRSKLKRCRETPDNEFLEEVVNRFDETVGEVDSRRKALEECLQELSEPNRELIGQYYSGEKDRQQIAVDQGRTFQALRQSIQRIRNFLSRCIEKHMPPIEEKL